MMLLVINSMVSNMVPNGVLKSANVLKDNTLSMPSAQISPPEVAVALERATRELLVDPRNRRFDQTDCGRPRRET